MLAKNVCAMLVVLIVASFIGFCVENVWIFIKHGFLDNRGMILPFLLGYGIACVLVYLCFGLPDSPHIFGFDFVDKRTARMSYAVCIFLAILVGESSFGHAVEHFTGVRWWDYTYLPLHIGRYTSIPTSVGFSIAIYMFMDKIFPIFYRIGEGLGARGREFGIFITVLLLAADNIHALLYMFRHQKTFQTWKLQKQDGSFKFFLRKNSNVLFFSKK